MFCHCDSSFFEARRDEASRANPFFCVHRDEASKFTRMCVYRAILRVDKERNPSFVILLCFVAIPWASCTVRCVFVCIFAAVMTSERNLGMGGWTLPEVSSMSSGAVP